MKNRMKIIGIAGAIGLLVVILDSKTAISGGYAGIKLCLQTVIPALLPFFLLSGIVCRSFLGETIPLLRPIGKLCGIPKGAESLLLLGFLGGYPVGAKNISIAEKSGALSQKDAHRMLGFCNNAGPAFLFGMAGCLFERSYIPWLLWLIHIFSALLVGCLLPGRSNSVCKLQKPENLNIIDELENAVRTMANVCGWVILFRVILAFFEKWFYFLLPTELCAWLSGLTELSNGIIGLQAITNDGLRFILCAGLLGFGGLCVAMQTVSITGALGTGFYFPGKIMQGCISILLASLLQVFLFDRTNIFKIHPPLLVLTILGIGFSVFLVIPRKNNSRNLSRSYV